MLNNADGDILKKDYFVLFVSNRINDDVKKI